MPDIKKSLTAGVGRIKSRLRNGAADGGPTPPANPEEAEERLKEHSRKLERLRRRVAKNEGSLARAREELKQARDDRDELKRARDEAPTPRPSLEETPVFFVVGRAKSGTTWVRSLMDSHPEVLCRGEGIFFGRGTDLGERRGLMTPTSLHGALADSGYLKTWIERRPMWTRGRDAEEHLSNLTRMSIEYFLADQLARSGKKIVGDKTPLIGEDDMLEISEVFPGARVIHAIRDGRDVAVSAVHHVWNRARHEGGVHDLSPEELAKREAYRADPEGVTRSGESIFTEKRLRGTARSWTEMVGKAVEDGPRLLGSNYAEVRYEDLLTRPHEEAGRLLRFLDADADEGNVNRCVEAASFERGSEGRRRGEEDPTAFLRKGVAGDWRGVFTAEDRRVFDEVAGGLLGRLGYERDDGR